MDFLFPEMTHGIEPLAESWALCAWIGPIHICPGLEHIRWFAGLVLLNYLSPSSLAPSCQNNFLPNVLWSQPSFVYLISFLSPCNCLLKQVVSGEVVWEEEEMLIFLYIIQMERAMKPKPMWKKPLNFSPVVQEERWAALVARHHTCCLCSHCQQYQEMVPLEGGLLGCHFHSICPCTPK